MEPELPPLTLQRSIPFWFRLGCISFGGPAGQIAMMHEELVVRRAWISERRFMHALNYCMVLPGPEAQQLATYIGWLLHGVKGGVVAGGLFILPSFCLLVLLSWLYVTFGHLPWIASILSGIQPVVLALVFAAAWRMGRKTLRTASLVAIALVAFLANLCFQIPFPWLILVAAILGWFLGRVIPAQFQLPSHHGPKFASSGSRRSYIGDDDPTPPHAVLNWKRWSGLALCGLLLWCCPLILLASYEWPLAAGHDPFLGDMGLFFSAAALVTFGGAYAVLPYVAEQAVHTYEWLEPHQMLDGLALGESTPGPLIIIVTFVGFVGGYQIEGGGWWSGFAGAIVATYFTFLPSFLFIMLGGPFVERMRGALRFDACLNAVMAAVVGMIVYLGIFLGYAILVESMPAPDELPTGPVSGWGGVSLISRGFRFDWLSALLSLMAWVGLTRYKTPLAWLFTIGMVLGILRYSLGMN